MPEEDIVYRDYGNRKRKAIERQCDQCREKYIAPLHELKRGKGRFCSQSCASKARVDSRREREELKLRNKDIKWSKDIAYLVGLITSDGTLECNSNRVSFSSSDLELVEFVKEIATSSLTYNSNSISSIEHEGYKTEYRYQFSHRKFYQFLIDIGLMPSKSLRIGKMNIPNQYFNHFLRGEFDGDGGFKDTKYGLYFNIVSGAESFVKWLKSRIDRALSVEGGSIRHRPRKDVWGITYYIRDTQLICNYMYNNADYYLSRKYNMAE